MRRLIVLIVLVGVLSLANSSLAGFIVPTFTGPFTGTQTADIQAAIANWEAELSSVNTLAVEFICDTNLGANGETTITAFYDQYHHQPKAASITLNNDDLFWDPTPNDYTDADKNQAQRDGISTTMHEICHALGWGDWHNDGFARFLGGAAGSRTWSDGTVTISVTDDGDHTTAAGLMNAVGALHVRNVIEDYEVHALIASHECYSPEPASLVVWSSLAGLSLVVTWRRRSRQPDVNPVV